MKKLILAILLSYTPSFATYQWGVVQSVFLGSAQATGTTITVTSTAGGNRCFLIYNGTTSTNRVSSITDNATGSSSTWVAVATTIATDTTSNNELEMWEAKTCKPGATAVTVNFSGALGWWAFYEISGLDNALAKDTSAVLSNQTASTTPLGPNLTTTKVGDFILEAVAGGGVVSGIHAGNEFTNDSTMNGGGYAHITSVVATVAAHRAQWDSTSFTYCSSGAAFIVADPGRPPDGANGKAGIWPVQ